MAMLTNYCCVPKACKQLCAIVSAACCGVCGVTALLWVVGLKLLDLLHLLTCRSSCARADMFRLTSAHFRSLPLTRAALCCAGVHSPYVNWLMPADNATGDWVWHVRNDKVGSMTGAVRVDGRTSHWRDCHFADTPSPSLLKRLLGGRGCIRMKVSPSARQDVLHPRAARRASAPAAPAATLTTLTSRPPLHTGPQLRGR